MNEEYVKSALRYYQQSINATMKSRYKKDGKVYNAKPVDVNDLTKFSESKIKAAINTYEKHKEYLKNRRNKLK